MKRVAVTISNHARAGQWTELAHRPTATKTADHPAVTHPKCGGFLWKKHAFALGFGSPLVVLLDYTNIFCDLGNSVTYQRIDQLHGRLEAVI